MISCEYICDLYTLKHNDLIQEAKSYLLNILVHYCQEVDPFTLSETMGRKPRASIKINWEFRMLEHSCIINGEIYRLISDEFIVQRDLIL